MKRNNTFRAKWSIYFLLYIIMILTCVSWSYQGIKATWIINAATIELDRSQAAMHPVRKLSQENSELKRINEELVQSIGENNKPVVVKVVNDGSAKAKALFKARKEWGDEHLFAFEQLIIHESNFNPSAQNRTSTAFGMFQFLDTTWHGYKCEKTEELDEQINCGIKYISKRYGNPTNAWKFWLSNSPHWY